MDDGGGALGAVGMCGLCAALIMTACIATFGNDKQVDKNTKSINKDYVQEDIANSDQEYVILEDGKLYKEIFIPVKPIIVTVNGTVTYILPEGSVEIGDKYYLVIHEPVEKLEQNAADTKLSKKLQ